MSHKIIKPEGIELIEYLNNGYAICNRCGGNRFESDTGSLLFFINLRKGDF